MPEKVTQRQLDALRILAENPRKAWNASTFAEAFWPDKEWMSGGSRYDASARHGGRMLARLEYDLGLVTHHRDRFLMYTYTLTEKGAAVLAEAKKEET